MAKAEDPAKAEAKPTTIPASVSSHSYSLQMGAMVMEENAEALKRKLDAGGFPAVIRKGTAFVSKQTVTVGDPTGRREAEALSRRLNVDGFPSQLLVVGGKHTPQIGAFFNLDEAIDLARELQKKNYHPKITSKPANTVLYQVRHGKFDSRAAAVRRGEEVKSKGFHFLVVRD
jgi:cell division septation protein DedD